jgi:hypothetical protein
VYSHLKKLFNGTVELKTTSLFFFQSEYNFDYNKHPRIMEINGLRQLVDYRGNTPRYGGEEVLLIERLDPRTYKLGQWKKN